jgi:hypothetical protein
VNSFDSANQEVSVIAESPIEDGGLWDLCELLTFFTGQRVTVPTYKGRHGSSYRYVGRGMEIYYAAWHAAAHAWPNRHKLVSFGLEMAFLAHNHAVFDMIQTQASHLTTALDIVCAKYPSLASVSKAETKLTNDAKAELKKIIAEAIQGCKNLSDPQKESFIRFLGARVDQGLAKGFVAKLQDLLRDLGAIDTDPPPEVLERVRFIDTVRNAITHSGRLPKPSKEESRHQLGQRVAKIVYHVIHDINTQAFLRQIGFEDEDRKRFALDSKLLRQFFTDGNLGPTIEAVSDLRILDRMLRSADDPESD